MAQRRPSPDPRPAGRKPARRNADVDYRNLAERAPAILFRYRLLPEPRMEYVNPAVTETLGYTPDDFYADPDLVFTLLDGESLQAIGAPDPAATGLPIVRRWRRRDGTYADVEDRTIAIRNGEGRLVAIEGVARDVSEELAIRQQLSDSRARLDAVVGHLPVILWATDPEGRLTFLDGAGLVPLGVRAEEMLGLSPGDVHPDAGRYRRHLRPDLHDLARPARRLDRDDRRGHRRVERCQS